MRRGGPRATCARRSRARARGRHDHDRRGARAHRASVGDVDLTSARPEPRADRSNANGRRLVRDVQEVVMSKTNVGLAQLGIVLLFVAAIAAAIERPGVWAFALILAIAALALAWWLED